MVRFPKVRSNSWKLPSSPLLTNLDYDPEEERRVQDSDEDSEADSGDDLAGTEHYATVR